MTRPALAIALLSAPGRFPTVSHDVGGWWEVLAGAGHRLEHHSVNLLWWQRILSPAASALAALRDGTAFASADAYCRAIAVIDAATDRHNRDQSDHQVTLAEGPRASGVDYHDSRAIIDAAQADTRLTRDIAASLAGITPPDVLLLRATAATDLLSAAIVARVLRARNPAMHIALIDHGYENFSLTSHLPVLAMTGTLFEAFDTIVAQRNEIDRVVPALIARLAGGEVVGGVLRRTTEAVVAPPSDALPAPLVPCFSPKPVALVRLSPAGCYWGRCVYCTQNAKYAGVGGPSKTAIAATIARIGKFTQTGCRTFIFADEALSPAMLRALARAIIDAGLCIAWSCRSKLERSFDPALLALVARAGCREILFGVEAVSPDLLRRMDKHVAGQTAHDAAALLRAIAATGVGVHVNLINGFPGETLAGAEATARWTIAALRDHPNATWRLNPFTVFPRTPIAADPNRWGIAALAERGDMPSRYDHQLDPAADACTAPAVAAFDRLQAAMERDLGWGALIAKPGGRSAFELYATSAHGIVFKSGATNPIDAARKGVPRGRTTRKRAFLTGATGAVGAGVLAALIEADWDVLALVRDPGAADLPCDTIPGDLVDLPALGDALGGMDSIIHCASPRSLDRATMLAGEVEATGRLLDGWSSGTFVYASSQTVYGLPDGPQSDADRVEPDNWYDLAKITNEYQLAFTARRIGRSGVSLRLPLVFSAAVRPGAGNYLLALMDALERGRSFVFADDTAMARDGSAFIADDDLGRAVVLAAGLPDSATFNIAGGFVSWHRLIMLLGDMAGLRPSFLVGERPREDEGAFYLPRSRTELITDRFDYATGFRPSTTLDQVLQRFVEAQRRDGTRPVLIHSGATLR